MKIKIILLFILILIRFKSLAQDNYKYSLSLKPINYSNIDLGNYDNGFIGRHFGVEFEMLISKNKKFSLFIPFTYGDLKARNITDYDRTGRDIYISPGLKYYFKNFNQNNGFAMSTNLLIGSKIFDESPWWNNYHFNGKFFGILVNAHYLKRIGGHFYLNGEIGIGYRHLKGLKVGSYFDENTMISYNVSKTETYNNGVANFSIGFQYRF